MSSVQTWSTFGSKDELKKHGLRVSASRVEDEQRRKRTKWLPWVSSNSITSEKGWKPLSMSTPILSALIILTLLLAATIEILAQRSASQGGLALSSSLDEIPRYAMWSYLYAPTVVAVLYSLIWSWVDLDVKRMQPWFELSKEGGATAEGSLFLDYPFDFVAVAPFKAFKRRHWPVVLAGTTMMIVFWAITPLQSAILGTGVITITKAAPVYAASMLAPIEKQVGLLDTEVLNNGYAVAWLGQSLPPFMTRANGNLPVYLNDTISGVSHTNWTVATTSYTTDLTCSAAKAEPRSAENNYLWYMLNTKGCNMTIGFNVHSNNSMLYIGYWSSPYSDYALRSPDCPLSADSTNSFLSIWMETYNKTGDTPGSTRADFNVSAMYCETSYFKQEVLLTVDSSTRQLVKDEMIPLSEKKKLGPDEFNSTAFEFLLGNGIAEDPGNRDKPFSTLIEQHPRLEGTGLDKPVSNMVPYALAGHILPRRAYADQQVLAEAYTRAHKYLFALAIDQVLVNDTDLTPGRLGNVTFPQTGIIVSRTFSAAVEGLLLLVTIATVALLWFIRSAPCALEANPSSIQRIGDLLTGDAGMLKRLQTVDNADDESLGNKLQSARMALVRKEYRGHISTFIVRLDRADSFGSHGTEGQSARDSFYQPIRPLALRKPIGLLFALIIMGAMAFLAYLKIEEASNRGLLRPTTNFEVLQLLENYIPTIFATLTEPFWVLLTRLLSMLQPFRDLWEGQAPARKTIEASYMAVPPQLVAWRATRSGHVVLLLACVMVLLSNVLAVGLGALFNEAPIITSYEHSFSPALGVKFDNASVMGLEDHMSKLRITSAHYQDHLYIALSNITAGTRLPPWATLDYFFQPHDLSSGQAKLGNATSYSLLARGFGARGNCTALPESEVAVDLPEVPALDGESTVCPDFFDAMRWNLRHSQRMGPSSRVHLELIQVLSTQNILENCGAPLLTAFGRSPNGTDANATITASFGICHPVFETAMFNVTVDPSGYVLDYSQVGKSESTLGYTEAKAQEQYLIDLATRSIGWSLDIWSNDTVTRDWLTHFIMLLTDSRGVLDPEDPPPDVERMRPIIEDIYRRLFAILLSLNQHIFEKPTKSTEALASGSSTGTQSYVEIRIFMDQPAFIMSMIVLSLNIVAAAAVYVRSAAFVLPRMPSTVGSIMAYIAPSRALWSSHVDEDSTFSFGRYVGLDGRAHVGIELDPYVVPIDPKSLELKRPWLRRVTRRRKRDDKPDGPWL